MPTQITQLDDVERNKTVLRVEGEMTLDDAVLLEKIALQMRDVGKDNIVLDLADLDFLDSESAPVLKRMQEIHGFEIEGIQFFVQNVINDTERKRNNG